MTGTETSTADCVQGRQVVLNMARHNDRPNARIVWLRAMPYRQYLRTDEWRVTRQSAIIRAGGACQVCNASNIPLSVHHKCYDHIGCEHDRDLITLCRECHEAVHGLGKDPPMNMREFLDRCWTCLSPYEEPHTPACPYHPDNLKLIQGDE